MSNSTFGTPLDYTVDLNALGFSDTGPGEFTIEVPVMENHLYEEEDTYVLVAAVTRAVGNMVSEVWSRDRSRSLSRCGCLSPSANCWIHANSLPCCSPT